MSLLLLRRLLRPSCSSLVRSSFLGRGLGLVYSNGFSSASSSSQSPPCYVWCGSICEADLRNIRIRKVTEPKSFPLEKMVHRDLLNEDTIITIGSCHGWVGTMKEDGILLLQDDLNPFASYSHPKRIPLPPLVTLPGCQTKMVTNVSMSSSSPEDEDCVVAVKFLGPQLSFCRPGQSNPEWTNIRIKNQCFHSSRVMFSEKDKMFCLPGSGGYLIGSWDLKDPKDKAKIQRLRFQNLPELTKTKCELLHSCSTSEHLVESRPTGETFLLKWYRKATPNGSLKLKMKTRALMVFKLDHEGNAVYTQDIGDLSIFLSKSEPFCVPATSFHGLSYSSVEFMDADECGFVCLDGSSSSIHSSTMTFSAPYYIPPQNI
ncbi:hypothetical protein AALP_AA2G225500 [Arabis alpina]|uniref:KIB1-4 beta-propeller domain-containing protein n=1 Tax=Arabis alpina TaxID=50452 RepID=A0A087HJA7_ARAAL|nr:hypothetical protein AALP_AA2G225500 [Arabis alpina]